MTANRRDKFNRRNYVIPRIDTYLITGFSAPFIGGNEMRFASNLAVMSLSGALMAAPVVAAETSRPVNGKAPKGSEPSQVALADAPTPSPAELIFVPITPCRAFSSPEALKSGKIANFQISGAGDLTSQGGPNGGCGVPAAATAVFLSLTGGVSTAPGSMKAFASGAPTPTAVSLRYRANENSTTGAIVGLSALGKIDVVATTAAKATGDVTGYFAPQIQVYMDRDGTAYSKTNRILSTQKLSTGSYRIDADRNLQLCSVHVNVDGGYFYSTAYPSGSSVYVNLWAIESGNVVPKDLYHNVSVKC